MRRLLKAFSIPLPLAVLALSAFGIGTTEFVIMGLLPDIARDLAVSIPKAGMLVTGYALSVAFGAPLMALVTSRFQRRSALIFLMGFFIAGNLLCAIAHTYWLLMVARVITALCHGAFFGIGAIEAASLVPENRRASAVALMFTGLTLANVLGVPMGTAFGQTMGWQSPFWVIAAIGVIAFVALIKLLPVHKENQQSNMATEVKALVNWRIWASLFMTVLFSGSMFTTFTYIAPILEDVTHLSANAVTYTLLLIGVGLTIGNIIGGKLADWQLNSALLITFVAIAVMQVLLSLASPYFIAAEMVLLVWGMATFAAVPGLQVNVVKYGKAAPNLISTLNIGAFNLGNALGAALGGYVIHEGHPLTQVPIAGAVLAGFGVLLTLRMRFISAEPKVTVVVASA